MNRAGLALLACLASATLVRAEATPASPRNNWFGVSIAVPTPGKHIGDHELGLRAGATFEGAAHPHVLVGAEIAYHPWPTTPEYMAAYDRYLRTWFRTFGSSTFAINASRPPGVLRSDGVNLDRGSLKIGFSSWPRIDDLDRPRLLSHGRADRRVSAVCGKCAGTCGTMGVLGDFSARIEARKYLKGAMVSDELASPSIANSNLWLQRWTPSTSDWKGGLIRQT